jgi:hypothetical protein
MSELMVADVLRNIITSILNLVLIFSLARPKYGKRVMRIAIVALILLQLGGGLIFYTTGNYSGLAKFNFISFFMAFFLLKPLFLGNLFQWWFTILTDLNVDIVIVVISYHLHSFFPYPMYAQTVLRIGFFVLVILLFRRFLLPYYWEALEKGSITIYLAIAILINLSYYIFADGGFLPNMSEKMIPMMLLIVLAMTAYAVMFAFLKKINSEYTLREDNLVLDMQQKHLALELMLYNNLINDTKEHRHDLRHHNTILAEYLAARDIEGASQYLQKYNSSIAEASMQTYCENMTANILIRANSRRAHELGVRYEVFAQIPEALPLSEPELGTLLANMLENALEACAKCDEGERFLYFTAKTEENTLSIEMVNSMKGTVAFENELPVSTKDGGSAIGTNSIRNLVKKHEGMVRFQQRDQTFITQVLLPLK